MKSPSLKRIITLGVGLAIAGTSLGVSAIDCNQVLQQLNNNNSAVPYYPVLYTLSAYCAYKNCFNGGNWGALTHVPGYNEGYKQCQGENTSHFNMGNHVYCIFHQDSNGARVGYVNLYAGGSGAPSGSGNYVGTGNSLLYKNPIQITIYGGGFISEEQMQQACSAAVGKLKIEANGYYKKYFNNKNHPKCRKSSIFLNPRCM